MYRVVFGNVLPFKGTMNTTLVSQIAKSLGVTIQIEHIGDKSCITYGVGALGLKPIWSNIGKYIIICGSWPVTPFFFFISRFSVPNVLVEFSMNFPKHQFESFFLSSSGTVKYSTTLKE